MKIKDLRKLIQQTIKEIKEGKSKPALTHKKRIAKNFKPTGPYNPKTPPNPINMEEDAEMKSEMSPKVNKRRGTPSRLVRGKVGAKKGLSKAGKIRMKRRQNRTQ